MSKGKYRKFHSRIAEAMSHSSRYSFEGKAKLARDCGVSKMAVSDLISGYHDTTYRVVFRVLVALEMDLGRRLELREIISFTGRFERPICAVVGCRGCLPEEALNEDGTVARAYIGVKPGEWMSFLQAEGREV